MLALVVAAAVGLQSASPPSPGDLLIEAMENAVATARARQAALPHPKDDAERIRRLGELDQAVRRDIVKFDFGAVPEADRPALIAREAAIMDRVDRENERELMRLLPKEGWFLKSRYGEQAASAAFYIVQHGPLSMQARILPVLEPLVAKGEVRGEDYALMFDRVAISSGKPQRYGSRFRCDGGKWRPYPIEDADQLEERRRAMGFGISFADYKARFFDHAPTCPQTLSPPPPGMKLD